MFTLRSFQTISLACINHMKATQDGITDFTVGSVARTLVEAPCVELDEFYQNVLAGILDAIPVAVYAAFSFDVIGSITARGLITIAFSQPIVNAFTIPAATIFKSNSRSYLSETSVFVDHGATSISLYASCSDSGVKGNCQAGTITQIANFNLPNTATISNAAFISGRDQESDAERMARFNAYVQSLVRGTPFSVKTAAKSTLVWNDSNQIIDYVSRCSLDETMGHVYIYLWGAGGTPSQALITNAQNIVDGWINNDGTYVPGYRPTGMRVECLSMSPQVIPITLLVKVFAGNTGGSTLTNMISTALAKLMISIESGSVLYVDAITETILALQGVQNVFVTANENITCGIDKVMTLGDLSVTYL